jgi:hypothetical protein
LDRCDHFDGKHLFHEVLFHEVEVKLERASDRRRRGGLCVWLRNGVNMEAASSAEMRRQA